ncbi:MAG: hypothetical protein WA777_17795, partial [Rhodanobacter sp.]
CKGAVDPWCKPLATRPDVFLESLFERWVRDGGSVVGDCGRRDDRNHLEQVRFVETRVKELIHVLLGEMTAFLDHCARQERQCCELWIVRKMSGSNGVNICNSNALLQSKCAVECDCPPARISDRISE